MILFKILNVFLIIMCLAMAGSMVWMIYEFQNVLEFNHKMIFGALALTSLTPIAYMIWEKRKR